MTDRRTVTEVTWVRFNLWRVRLIARWHRRQRRRLQAQLLAEYEAEHGVITPEEMSSGDLYDVARKVTEDVLGPDTWTDPRR